jgi:hypothetical protein
MFRHVAAAFIFLASTGTTLNAQVLSKETIRAFRERAGQDTNVSTLDKSSKHASLWTTTLPVVFSRLEKEDGDWRLGANMSIGGSYMFVTGKTTPQLDGSYRLDPDFMIGPVANLGITPGDAGKLDGTLMVGAVMGFSSFAVLGGYDVLLNRPVIGVGIQIQSLTFTQSLTRLVSLR